LIIENGYYLGHHPYITFLFMVTSLGITTD